jgi:hypothetical protein
MFLVWNHINLTGDYRWQGDKRVAQGQFRPLRRPLPSAREVSVQKFPFLEVTTNRQGGAYAMLRDERFARGASPAVAVPVVRWQYAAKSRRSEA